MRAEVSLRMDMTRESMRKIVLGQVKAGYNYHVKSVTSTLTETHGYENSKLIYVCRNFIVFEHQNGTRECFTYADIWKQMHTGEFW